MGPEISFVVHPAIIRLTGHFVITGSVVSTTGVISVALLLERTGSVVDEVTETVLLKSEQWVKLAAAVIVSVAVPLKFRLPIDQEEDPFQTPILGVKLTRVNPAGKISLTLIFVPVEGPKFLTTIV